MARKNTIPKKPEWFNPERYLECANWDCEKWLMALRRRIFVYDYIYMSKDSEIPGSILASNLDRALEIGDFHKKFGAKNHFSCTDTGEYVHFAVEPMSIYSAQLVGIYVSGFKEDEKDNYENHKNPLEIPNRNQENVISIRSKDKEVFDISKDQVWRRHERERRLKSISYDEYYKDCTIKPRNKAHIVVDLNLSDDVLIEQFAACITDMRRMLGWETTPRKITENDLLDWHKQRLLPYLDIWFYNEINECGFTLDDLGIFIFPEDPIKSSGKYIAETTRPNALNLISQTTINALEGQILKHSPKPIKNGGRPKKKAKTPPKSKI